MFIELGKMLEPQPELNRIKKLRLPDVEGHQSPVDLFLKVFAEEALKYTQIGSVRFDLIDHSRGDSERIRAGVVSLPNKDYWPRAYSVAIWAEEWGDSLSVLLATFVDDHERIPFFGRNVSGFEKRIGQLESYEPTQKQARQLFKEARDEVRPLQSLAKALYDDVCDRLGYEADVSGAQAQG